MKYQQPPVKFCTSLCNYFSTLKIKKPLLVSEPRNFVTKNKQHNFN